MKHTINEIQAVIESRRTIRPEFFSDQKVPRTIVEELLESAKWAPTHKLTQPWFFNIFMHDGLKQLSTFQSQLYKEMKPGDDFDTDKYEKLKARPTMASVVIGIGLKRDEAEKNPIAEEIASVAIAVQNMMLLATSHGIGSYWNSGGITYAEKTKNFMQLEEKDLFLGFLYLGYPKDDWPRKTRRKPRKHYTRWVEA